MSILSNFNILAWNNQTTTQWDLLPWGIAIWLIDDGMLISFCGLDDVIFWIQQCDTGKWCNWSHIDCQLCIPSEPTNQELLAILSLNVVYGLSEEFS